MAHGRGSRPLACKQCGKLRKDGHVISFRALCEDCAVDNQTKSARHLHAGAGHYYDRWADSMRSVAARLG